MSDATQLPRAGWYADPENPAAERWWNGMTWGDERRPSTVGAVTPPPVPTADTGIPPIPVAPQAAQDPIPAATDGGAAPSGASTTAEATTHPVTPPPVIATPVDARPNPYATPQYSAPAAPYGSGYGTAYAPAASAGPHPNVIAIVGFSISMASIVLSFFIPFLISLAGGIVSAVGLAKANRLARAGETRTARGLALAGTIVGFVTALLGILIAIAFFALILAIAAPFSYY